MSDIITPELVTLDAPLGTDKQSVIRALAERVVAQGRARSAQELFDDAWAREQKDETGLPGGIGIPHARSASVTEPTLAFARLTPGVDFGAPDGPADIVFLIAAPEGADEAHLSVLSQLARSLMNNDFMAGLRSAQTPAEAVKIITDAVTPAAAPAAAPATAAPAATRAEARTATKTKKIVAVTACATGIAHTFMAADALTAAGAETEGVELIVEPQGSSGYKALPQSVIDDADAVIFAVDVDVREPQRFAGKPVVRAGVKRGIEQPKQLIAEALAASENPNAARVQGGAAAASASEAPVAQQSVGRRIQRWLLTGVSYMIPFVAGGGLLIALGFLLGGYEVTKNAANV
ncbi:fructose PTS transporter subunit IIA, partial [uncultured Microbacterium sp.]